MTEKKKTNQSRLKAETNKINEQPINADQNKDLQAKPASETISVADVKAASEKTTMTKTNKTQTTTNGTTLRRVRRKKRKNSNGEEHLGFNWFFWISFVVIAIPVSVFIYLLLEASKQTGTPILGNRLDIDLKGHAESDTTDIITQDQVADVKTAIIGIDGVEDASVTLTVETLRIYVDATDTITDEAIKTLTDTVYQTVVSKLPVETYFTQHGDYKQYDVEITVYNSADATDTFLCYNLIKNSSMENYLVNMVTTPKNAELAENLHNPTKEDPNTPDEPDENDPIEDDEE